MFLDFKFIRHKQVSLTLALALFLAWSSQIANAQYTGLILTNGMVQVEGDVITTPERAAVLLGQSPGGVHPNFSYAPSRLWPNSIVPYDFDSGVTDGQKKYFLAAMLAWVNSFPGVATLSFIPRNNDSAYIHFQTDTVANLGFSGGSTDNIGYDGGVVTIKITSDGSVSNVFLIAHEVGHALGRWHEQSRDDRDNYINILTANIQSGFASQFSKQTPEATFGPYDYDSVMQYFACAFSICNGQSPNPSCACADANCVTMQAVYSAQQCNIGQRSHLSGMDMRGMAFMYGPSSWRFLYVKSGSSADGSFQQPYNSMSQAVVGTPPNSTLWLGPGSFSAAGMNLTEPMTLKAAIPDLQLQSDGSLGPSPSGYATLR
jgi:Astacin (Peptidase family M12A)